MGGHGIVIRPGGLRVEDAAHACDFRGDGWVVVGFLGHVFGERVGRGFVRKTELEGGWSICVADVRELASCYWIYLQSRLIQREHRMWVLDR